MAVLKEKENICVALSGGPDSTALIMLLREVKGELGISLSACHVNHGLRGRESSEDETFVRELAGRLSIPIKIKRIDVEKYRNLKGGSLQAVARELRYLFFQRLIKQGFADSIAVAHTLDDTSETVLMNFLRGSGVEGLTGIPPIRNEKIIRPFIEISKREILEYLEANRIPFRLDSSNISSKYLRNRLRNELIPELENRYNPALRATLKRTSEIMTDVQDYLSREAEKALVRISLPSGRKKGVVLDTALFNGLERAIQREVLRRAIEEARGSLMGLSYDHIEKLRDLANRGKSGELDLPRLKAILSGTKLFISTAGSEILNPFSYNFNPSGLNNIDILGISIGVKPVPKKDCKFDKSCRTVFVDADAIPQNAVIRNRREGDRFRPLGAKGSRKLKKFFIDNKISKWERDSIPLLASGSTVLWIAGLRLSENIGIKETTRRILKLELKEE